MACFFGMHDMCNSSIVYDVLARLAERGPAVIGVILPLVHRPRMSGGAARRLARFVAVNLLAILRDRRDFDAETTRDVAATVMRRLAEEGEGPGELAEADDPAAAAMARAQALHAAGNLAHPPVPPALPTAPTF